MMQVATTTTTMESSDEDIPFVQAVYIDGELTEVPPDQVAVHSVSLEEEDDTSTVAVAVATEISPRTSSSFSYSNGCRGSYHEEDTFSTSAASLHETDSANLQSSSQHSSQERNENLDIPSTPSGNDDDQVFGAGAAGAVLGLLMGGPLFSIVLGLGMLYHSQQDGAMGDVARAMGDVALLTRTRFEELNEKHHLVDKGKNAAGRALKKIKETDRRRHHRRRCKKEKLQKFLATCWKSLMAFENKHHLLSRVSTKAKNHLDALVEQYAPASDPSEQAANEQQPQQ